MQDWFLHQDQRKHSKIEGYISLLMDTEQGVMTYSIKRFTGIKKADIDLSLTLDMKSHGVH